MLTTCFLHTRITRAGMGQPNTGGQAESHSNHGAGLSPTGGYNRVL